MMNGRINLSDLKSQLVKNVGPDRAKLYFQYLSKLLSQKLSKTEFNKLCISTLGPENLHLHNQLIHAVLKNAYQAKTPPQSTAPIYSNGHILHHTFKKSISSINGKNEVVIANGHLKRPFHLLEEEQLAEESVKKHRKIENVEHNNNVPWTVPIQAPFGIPFCRPSVGGSRIPSTCKFNSSVEFGELSDSHGLSNRMDQIAKMHGLDGVKLDGANLLNLALDVHLKRLIKSCTELVRSRSSNGQIKKQMIKQQFMEKSVNGIWQGSNIHIQSSGPPIDNRRSISVNDFRAAIELNPHQLREDWSLLLEKICVSSFEE